MTLDLSVSKFKVLSIADNIAKYTPELTDNDIKGFVWYNRTLGIPMTGFEQWFIGNTIVNTVTALYDVDYLNQQWQPIGKFQKGDTVGKVTRFEHVYDGVNYVAVRQYSGVLCMVRKDALDIQADKYEADIEALHDLVKSKSLLYMNGMFLPLHVYTNTDYDSLKKYLESDKAVIVERYGQDVWAYHASIISGYTSMRVDHPIRDKRYKLNPYGDICRDTLTTLEGGEEINVTKAFEKWVKTLKASDFNLVSKSTFENVIIWGHDKAYTRGMTDDQKKQKKEEMDKKVADANLECERLFSEFCVNALAHETVLVLNKKINETYNRSILVNTAKVPVGFICSSLFGDYAFDLRTVQVQAFKFAISRNNYCLALTVGFGKTSVNIAILSYLLTTGTIKKPLIVVPKPVIKNWEKELFGYWTDGKGASTVPVKGWKRMFGVMTDCGFEYVNIFNLAKPYVKTALSLKDKTRCMILCSYEALNKMYIADESIRIFVIARWKEILENRKNDKAESDRESSKKISSLVASLNRVDKDGEIPFDKLKIDSIYYDEAHRLKNMFSGVPADPTNRVESGFKGTPSARALRAFYLSQYLQKINGRIGFLTATPFSNSPLEVYTMLCFLNYAELVKNNVYKIQAFVEIFFNEVKEYKVNSKNEVESESVMKSYKNKPILYKILSNTFIYRDNPKDADIKRPCIVRFPNKEIKLMLKQSILQKIQRDVLTGESVDWDFYEINNPEIADYITIFRRKWAKAQTNKKYGGEESDLGMAGKILSASKSSAVSPFCNSPVAIDFITDEPWKELYLFSPKIRFTIECIFSMVKYHESIGDKKSSSFLIYIGLGVNILEPFKVALERICKFKKGVNVSLDEDDDDDDDVKGGTVKFDEVEIIHGTADDKELNRRERIGELFNQGRVKVIIGTDTIKEGLNLQVNCATLFILAPTWNSTDIVQVEGRIHRQKNEFAFARAITPLVTRTLDSFIYQKYDEKRKRLSDIWSDDGISTTGSMTEDIDAERQKILILDDARQIALIRSSIDARTELNSLNKIKDEYESLVGALNKSSVYKHLVAYFTERLPQINEICQNNLLILETVLGNFGDNSPIFLRNKKERIKDLISYYQETIGNIKKAMESGLVVDMVNIFTGAYARRNYSFYLTYDDQLDFVTYCTKLGLNDVKRLLIEPIFQSIGITDTEDDLAGYESCQGLKEIYSSSFLASKYILEPEGLSLSSTEEELNAVKDKFAKTISDSEAVIAFNFDTNKYSGDLEPKAEYIASLEKAARIELDEENKLAKNDTVLAEYFTQATNPQLSVKIDDIDLEKCPVPYELVDEDRLRPAVQLDEIENDYATYKKLYELLKKVVLTLDVIEVGFNEQSGAYTDENMPLTVQVHELDKNVNIFSRYKGILLRMENTYMILDEEMTKPRIEFAVYQNEGIAIPLSYEVSSGDTHYEFVNNGDIIKMKLLIDTVNFCYTWVKVLLEQKHTVPVGMDAKTGRQAGKRSKSGQKPAPDSGTSSGDTKPGSNGSGGGRGGSGGSGGRGGSGSGSGAGGNDSRGTKEINTIGDRFFTEFPDKILGEMSIADFHNMIVVKGTKDDVVAYFDKLFSGDTAAAPKPGMYEEYLLDEVVESVTNLPIWLRKQADGTYTGVIYEDGKPERLLPAPNQGQAEKIFIDLKAKQDVEDKDRESEYVFIGESSQSLVKFSNGSICDKWIQKLGLYDSYEHVFIDNNRARDYQPVGHYAVQKLNSQNFMSKGVFISNMEKPYWMLEKPVFLQKLRDAGNYPVMDAEWERLRTIDYRKIIEDALEPKRILEDGNYTMRSEIRYAIERGTLTKHEAANIIESAGLPVPTDIRAAAGSGSESGLPPHIAELYSKAATLRFTLKALKMQMGDKGLHGSAKAEFDRAYDELNRIESHIDAYERSKNAPEEKEQAAPQPLEEIEIDNEYANFLIDQIRVLHAARYPGEDIKNQLRHSWLGWFNDKGADRANNMLEDLYTENLPEGERVGVYSMLRMNFKDLQNKPADKIVETDQDKENRFYDLLIAKGFNDSAARMNAGTIMKALKLQYVAIDSLHLGNKNLREIWMQETGVQLPNTQGGTVEAIKKYFASIGGGEKQPDKAPDPAKFEDRFTFMKDNPMQRGRAIPILEKKIMTAGRAGIIMPIYEWIEGMPKTLEVQRDVKLGSKKSEKGYTLVNAIGDHIIKTEAELQYFEYLVAGGYPYSKYRADKQLFDDAAKKVKDAQRDTENKEREEQQKRDFIQSEINKYRVIKELLEGGKDEVLKRITEFNRETVARLLKERQTAQVKEQIDSYNRYITQATYRLDYDYETAKSLYKIEDGRAVKKYDWQVGDSVAMITVARYDDDGKQILKLIPTVITDVKDGTAMRPHEKTYVVEPREGIFNKYTGYDGLRPVDTVEKKDKPEEKEQPKKRFVSLDEETKAAIAKYGWTFTEITGGARLSNRKQNEVAVIHLNGDKYIITRVQGEKLLSGNDNLAKGVERVIKDYFYGTTEDPKPKPEPKPEPKPAADKPKSAKERKEIIQKQIKALNLADQYSKDNVKKARIASQLKALTTSLKFIF